MEFHEWNKIVDNIIYWIKKIILNFRKKFPWKFNHSSIESSQMIFYAHSSIKHGWSFFMVETKLNWIIFHDGITNVDEFPKFFHLKMSSNFIQENPFILPWIFIHKSYEWRIIYSSIWIDECSFMESRWIVIDMKWILNELF
jgi:hypothetical protein